VEWLKSAYPRALFYLGFIQLERGDPGGALELLAQGERLEANPCFVMERAQALCALKRFSEAHDAYESLLARPEEIDGLTAARVLRGLGFVSTELGRIVEAKGFYLASLQIDPASEVARHELAYLETLSAGAPATAARSTATSDNFEPSRCGICGGPVGEGTYDAQAGKSVCAACLAAKKRGWWQSAKN
jgi:tetratricopeptide (TPR) repeat protein